MKLQSSGVLLLALAIFSWAGGAQAGARATGPPQPAAGPGSSQAAHRSVTARVYGEGNFQYWLFEPAQPKPRSAPVVVFNHGWGAMQPDGYAAWIEHIVRRGNIVIYPRYQAALMTNLASFFGNDVHAIKAALKELSSGKQHVRPQLDKLAAVGHSAGGQLTAMLASDAGKSGLPQFRAVMCVEPGADASSWGIDEDLLPLDHLADVPPSTLLLAVVGDRDDQVGEKSAVKIINATTAVPAANKNLVTMITDEHGQPPLIADHYAPTTSARSQFLRSYKEIVESEIARVQGTKPPHSTPVHTAQSGRPAPSDAARGAAAWHQFPIITDALDYYGTWKLFDALTDAAFYNKNRDYALGNTKKQRFMGKWSDGVAVKELVVEVGHADPKHKRVTVTADE